jgi:hypothetical protein
MAKSVDEMFAGIKPEKHVRPKKAIRVAEPVGPVVTENDKTVTIALTMSRELFERYNTGKDRNRFRDAMVRQLQKKFEG